MDAITALTQRVSSPRLADPAPQGSVRETIFNAALRAADHANLRPWRFLTIEGEARLALGQLFLSATQEGNPGLSAAEKQRITQKPLRAPLILVAVARCAENAKVPEIEQLLSAGAAVQNIITAAYAQGVGAYWRTGAMAYHPKVREGLGLSRQEKIVGFVYLGTPTGTPKDVPQLEARAFFKTWSGN